MAARGVEKWVGHLYFMVSGGARQTKTEKKNSAFLTGQENKHNRQHKRRKDQDHKAYLSKGLRTHNFEGLFTKIHHMLGVLSSVASEERETCRNYFGQNSKIYSMTAIK